MKLWLKVRFFCKFQKVIFSEFTQRQNFCLNLKEYRTFFLLLFMRLLNLHYQVLVDVLVVIVVVECVCECLCICIINYTKIDLCTQILFSIYLHWFTQHTQKLALINNLYTAILVFFFLALLLYFNFTVLYIIITICISFLCLWYRHKIIIIFIM